MGQAHGKSPYYPAQHPGAQNHRVPLTWYMHMLGLIPLGR